MLTFHDPKHFCHPDAQTLFASWQTFLITAFALSPIIAQIAQHIKTLLRMRYPTFISFCFSEFDFVPMKCATLGCEENPLATFCENNNSSEEVTLSV